MQLTWFPFIISPGHLFNIGRREFCGFSLSIYVCPPLLCSIFLVFQFLCNLIFSYFHLHSVPICRSISICANLGQLLYFPCIFSVFVRTFHAALTITCPCNGAELRSRGKTLSRLFSISPFYLCHFVPSSIYSSSPWNSRNVQMGLIPSKVVSNGCKCCK